MNTEPFILENERAKLEVLTLENHKVLQPVASEKDIIPYSPSRLGSSADLEKYVKTALEDQVKGISIPFIIFDKMVQAYAGCTRFGHIDARNRVLHIGWTWLGKDFRGTGLNSSVKLLMLAYAFEIMNFEKVEFRIDERNIRSRKAVEKLGASLEGILRSDVIMRDGYRRNTCCYGILKSEWPQIKKTLLAL
ncbi:GNAT family protein [Ascidiimonas aurantiaca]|uniref:GNAT family N-acetyltransferase n=1 Tax=Ascidiimonas aurantiaca TaxID=1685432 RepID=UPI0030ED3495